MVLTPSLSGTPAGTRCARKQKKESDKQHEILIKEATRVKQIEVTRLRAYETIIASNLQVALVIINSGPSKDRVSKRARIYQNCLPYLEQFAPNYEDDAPPHKRAESD